MMLGEPGIHSLRDAGFVVSKDDVVICSRCHAPLAVVGSWHNGDDYLIRLTDAPPPDVDQEMIDYYNRRVAEARLTRGT